MLLQGFGSVEKVEVLANLQPRVWFRVLRGALFCEEAAKFNVLEMCMVLCCGTADRWNCAGIVTIKITRYSILNHKVVNRQ